MQAHSTAIQHRTGGKDLRESNPARKLERPLRGFLFFREALARRSYVIVRVSHGTRTVPCGIRTVHFAVPGGVREVPYGVRTVKCGVVPWSYGAWSVGQSVCSTVLLRNRTPPSACR
jgi:hypothetical protein